MEKKKRAVKVSEKCSKKKKGSQTEEEKSVFVEKVESCFLILAFDVPFPSFFFYYKQAQA